MFALVATVLTTVAAPGTAAELKFDVSGTADFDGSTLHLEGYVTNLGDTTLCVVNAGLYPSAPIDKTGTFGFERLGRTPVFSLYDGVRRGIPLGVGERLRLRSELVPILADEVNIIGHSGDPAVDRKAQEEIRAEIRAGEYQILADVFVAFCPEFGNPPTGGSHLVVLPAGKRVRRYEEILITEISLRR